MCRVGRNSRTWDPGVAITPYDKRLALANIQSWYPIMLHEFIDHNYGQDGDRKLRQILADGADPNQVWGPFAESALHVAARRRRVSACRILLDNGASINSTTAGGKSAYAHAARRGFKDVCKFLVLRGANTETNGADQLAISMSNLDRSAAESILAAELGLAKTGNPEEDRLLADVAGRKESWPVRMLVDAGADLTCRGLDDGTPLHQAAWFGQSHQVRFLLDAGAPVDVYDSLHNGSPLGWAVHGSKLSGGAGRRQRAYVAIVRDLLAAEGAKNHPTGPAAYYSRLIASASRPVRKILEQAAQPSPVFDERKHPH